MDNKLSAVLVLTVGLLLVPESTFPHHGAAKYDRQSLITVEGTVTEFKFGNPHIRIHFEVESDKGDVQKWTGECSGVNQLRRNGWSSRSLKPGDQITAIGNPAKDGSYRVRLTKVVLANGQELSTWR